MMERYIVVTINNDSDEIEMLSYTNERSVLEAIGDLDYNESVERVFKLNEYGDVTHYNIVFKGRLKLEEVAK